MDTPAEKLFFRAADYGVWALILACSIGIGVYHACSGGKQQTTEEFLVGNRRMHPVPVGLSISISFISAVTFLGITGQSYAVGCSLWLFCWAIAIGSLIAGVFFLPVFRRLKLTSANEYLEHRFNKATRLLAACIVVFNMFFYMGVVLYGPALALSQVAGLSEIVSILTIGIACTFYTTIGGFKAVIWTDAFQAMIMLAGFLAVIIKGSIHLGGLTNVLRIVDEGNRLKLIDPTSPASVNNFWSILIGVGMMFVSVYGTNQAQVQRYLSCPSTKVAQIALLIATCISVVITSGAVTCGLVMYAYYADCDPLSSGKVAKVDQMMPYFTMELFTDYPGLPGLFLSAIFSASLSSISSGLNAVAAVTTEDVIRPIWPNLTDLRYTQLSKLMAVIYGVLTIGFAFLASAMGDLLKVSLKLFGMLGGPTVGLFSSGMFIPWINSKGAFTGTVMGLIFSLWVGVGSVVYPSPNPLPPFSTNGCAVYNESMGYTMSSVATNVLSFEDDVTVVSGLLEEGATMISPTIDGSALTEEPSRSAIMALYAMSSNWYSPASCLITLVVAAIVSLITGRTNPKKLNPLLVFSLADACGCLPESWTRPLRCRVGEDFNDDTKLLGLHADGQNGVNGATKDPEKNFDNFVDIPLGLGTSAHAENSL